MFHWLTCLAVMAGTYCGVLPDPDPLPVPQPIAVPVAQPVSAQTAEYGISLQAVSRYLWALDGPTLIRIAWHGTGQEARALAIAKRESGFNCAAKNRHSSATGLFQTLSLHRGRTERLGFSWADIAGPNCYADVMVAFDMWKTGGWGPWRT